MCRWGYGPGSTIHPVPAGDLGLNHLTYQANALGREAMSGAGSPP
ncbi:MAG: hypothetical protein JWN52_7991 [Actinomycetia bacterium]|nr:hypothetical protein [Actinomycetes bacterium]